jgi:hypothetical protein
MPKPLFRPPNHLIKEWPEVFEDLYMNTMPVAYLEMIRLEFGNGRVWEIDIQEQLQHSDSDSIADKLVDTFQEYKEDIQKIDFKINVDKLKADICNQTRGLFD